MIDQLHPAVVQVIRSIVQAAWSALFTITGVAEFFDAVGVDSEAALAIVFPIVLGLFIIVARGLEKLHPIFGWVFNGIARQPEYSLAA